MKNKSIALKSIAMLSSLLLALAPLSAITAAEIDSQNSQNSITSSNISVSMGDNYYSLQNITVTAGTRIVWTNNGTSPHTITSTTGIFESGNIGSGSTYSYTFNTPGTYNYFCRFHGSPNSGMTGTVIVTSSNSQSTNTQSTISGTVVQSAPPLIINSITPVKTSAIADGTFENGWSWVFDISAPMNETSAMMKFNNWLSNSSQGSIPTSNNMRFYSSQSSNAYSQNNAIYITSPNVYSTAMYLTGDLNTSPATRRFKITVEMKVPIGTQIGSYSTNFGIKTQ